MSPIRKVSKKLIILLIVIFLVLVPRSTFQSLSAQPKETSMATLYDEPGFVLEIPQKALFRNTVTVSAQTKPGINCELTYIPPSGETTIMNTIANEDGKCTWKWIIDEMQGKGNGRLIFTIDGVSETHFIEIRSSF